MLTCMNACRLPPVYRVIDQELSHLFASIVIVPLVTLLIRPTVLIGFGWCIQPGVNNNLHIATTAV